MAGGSLTGRLTDLHSRPVDGAILVLRNAATGAVAQTTTAKNGTYRFMGLAPGEYTLVTGSGHLDGIFISAGHEARMQAAFDPDRREPALPGEVHQASVRSEPTLSPKRAEPSTAAPIAYLSKPPAEQPSTVPTIRGAILGLEPIESVSLAPVAVSEARAAVNKSDISTIALYVPAPALIESTRTTANLEINPTLAEIAAQPLMLRSAGSSMAIAAVSAAQSQLRAAPIQVVAAARSIASDSPAPVVTLSGEQLQALPLAGRRWENFVMDVPVASAMTNEDSQTAPHAERQGTSLVVDGASTRLAFGSRAGGRLHSASLMGPGTNELGVSEVRTVARNGEAQFDPGAQSHVETRRGTQALHGQAFFFDRQNLLGAQNPFTQWVKETAPATPITVPVFTPVPYTAEDRSFTWGFGAGSRIARTRLVWFAALDGMHREFPGVSSVRHPDQFFAQPSGDEMQVLSARLGLNSANPVVEGLSAYSGMLETLSGLLGPAARNADQQTGFLRVDGKAGERHNFTLEGTGARWSSPGGGLSRTAETYGNHSFGAGAAREYWFLGRWGVFVTPNLMVTTQGSLGRHILSQTPDTPSAFEQTLNVNAWGQLPQIVVDSRNGFTIGNPARFGSGSYPDERLFEARQDVSWVHGTLMAHAGADWRHNADATSMVRNHTGTYHYSSVENFNSDALVFEKYGLSGALDPMRQHNCDQHGKAWRDSNGQLHGLGYLPCYSYYTQTMGPTDWHLSTNDVASYATAQWQPVKRLVISAGMRWQREFLPPPIALVNNPDLPLTEKLPALGNEWAPRATVAWGSGESRWPVLRFGYGMFFGRTQNSVLETALTQTGSLKGDLNFFMRPTDNLSGGGAPPFPYVLAGEPSKAVKPGAVEFGPGFENPEIHQAEATAEENLPGRVQVSAAGIMSLGRRLPVTIDTNFDPATNPGTITYGVVDADSEGPIKARRITVPFFASWPDSTPGAGSAGRLNANYQQITELMSRANSTYEAAVLRVSRYGRRGLSFHGRYTYAHAMDWNPNESTHVSGGGVLDPTDFSQEYGTSNLDIRHSASAGLIWNSPWKLHNLEGYLANGWMLSGIGQFHTGLPFTMRTSGSIPQLFESTGATIVGLGPGMNGSGGDNRIYGVGRNTYRYPSTWKIDLRLGKKFNLGQMRELELLAESFNLFNHQNVTQIETTGYYISRASGEGGLPTLNFLAGLKPGQVEFGKPLDVNATDFFHPRQFNFGLRMRF
jgi:Carboxypeptidase regulatory-like domain